MAAADATTTLRVGTMVLANDYRHPVVRRQGGGHPRRAHRRPLRARHRRRVDDHRLRGGRHPARPRRASRIERLAEALAVLEGLWAGGPCTVRRRALPDRRPRRAARSRCTPGGPPIVIGGGGQRVLRLAGREADVVGINVNLRGRGDRRAGLPRRHARARPTGRSGGCATAAGRPLTDSSSRCACTSPWSPTTATAVVEELRARLRPHARRGAGDPARPRRHRRARSATSSSSAASAGASATSACPPTSSSPSPRSWPACRRDLSRAPPHGPSSRSPSDGS